MQKQNDITFTITNRFLLEESATVDAQSIVLTAPNVYIGGSMKALFVEITFTSSLEIPVGGQVIRHNMMRHYFIDVFILL